MKVSKLRRKLNEYMKRKPRRTRLESEESDEEENPGSFQFKRKIQSVFDLQQVEQDLILELRKIKFQS